MDLKRAIESRIAIGMQKCLKLFKEALITILIILERIEFSLLRF